MVRTGHAAGVLAAAMVAAMAMPARAEVLDATYRGTMVCEKLPFTKSKAREAIEVTIAEGAVRYSHVVRLGDAAGPAEAIAEEGTGTLKGNDLSLKGAWKGGGRQYEAEYSGTFVRRSAKLKGTQTWTVASKTFARVCTGAIKRPLKAFLPRKKT